MKTTMKRTVSRWMVPIGALLIAGVSAAQPAQAANGLSLTGTCSFEASGSTVTIKAGRVANDSTSRTSGSLRVEVWAIATPYGGGQLRGYRLGQFQVSPLAPGYAYANGLSQKVAYTPPPTGYWYTACVVTEWNGSQWVVQDHLNFSGPQRFGPAAARPYSPPPTYSPAPSTGPRYSPPPSYSLPPYRYTPPSSGSMTSPNYNRRF